MPRDGRHVPLTEMKSFIEGYLPEKLLSERLRLSMVEGEVRQHSYHVSEIPTKPTAISPTPTIIPQSPLIPFLFGIFAPLITAWVGFFYMPVDIGFYFVFFAAPITFIVGAIWFFIVLMSIK